MVPSVAQPTAGKNVSVLATPMTSSNTPRSTTDVGDKATFVSFATVPEKSEYISRYALPWLIAVIAAVMSATDPGLRSAEVRVPPQLSKGGQKSSEPGGGHSWNITGP